MSLALVPPNHPLLDPRILEAEATGLLDRLLGALQDSSRCASPQPAPECLIDADGCLCPPSDALIVDATLNSLSILVRTRPATASRILNAVLSFNPLKHSIGPMTPRTRVVVKSMEKTTRMLLIHLLKR